MGPRGRRAVPGVSRTSINGAGMHEEANGKSYMYAQSRSRLIRFNVNGKEDVVALSAKINFAAGPIHRLI